MSKLNNEQIKDLLSHTTVDTNFDLEWDEIESKMDKEDKKRRGIWWISGIFLVGLVVACFLVILNDNKPEPVKINTKDLTNNVEKEAQMDIESVKKDHVENDNTLFNNSTNVHYESNPQISEQSSVRINNSNINSTTTTNIDQRKNTNGSKIYAEVEPTNLYSPSTILHHSISNFDQKGVENSLQQNGLNWGIESENSNYLTDPNPQLLNKSRPYIVNISEIGSIKNEILVKLRNNIKTPITRPKLTEPLFSAKNYFYADLAFSEASFRINKVHDNDYNQKLNNDYKSLTKIESNIGFGRNISQKWKINIGIKYDRYRSIYRGQVVRQETAVITKDSAFVFVNSFSENIYKSGDVNRITTTTANIQQYNYLNHLGINLGARYSFLGPLYAGVDMHWRALNWQSGRMLDPDMELSPLDELVSKSRKINLGLDFGFNIKVTDRLGIEGGIRYNPSQFSFYLDDVNFSSHSIGGQMRLMVFL